MTDWSIEALEVDLRSFHLGPVSFGIGPGETLAVLGPTGSGKSTLLRALGGLVPICSGRLWRSGEDLSSAPPEHRRLGYVPQGLALFPHLDVRGNVGYGVDPADRARVDELLARFDLARLAGRRPSTLSGGQAQRVALARALARRAELLLWDEPLGAVDLVGREAMVRLVGEVARAAPVARVLVTHEPEVAFALADRCLVLEEGRAVYAGTPDGLLERPPSPFAARFAGFDNVVEPPAEAVGEFARWLRERSGPRGVGFPARAVGPADGDGVGWTAEVARVAPRPGGRRVWARVGAIALVGEAPADSARPLRPGSPWRFTIDPGALRPIGQPGTVTG